jgi:hypothetical protein
VDPVDSDPNPDPEHCSRDKYFLSRPFKIKPAFLGVRDGSITFLCYLLFFRKNQIQGPVSLIFQEILFKGTKGDCDFEAVNTY